MNTGSHGGMIPTGKIEEFGEKPVSVVLSTHFTWTDPGANPNLRVERPVTNRLSHGTALNLSLEVQ
jgi:hypothetical protein